jgi:hypothetical protein
VFQSSPTTTTYHVVATTSFVDNHPYRASLGPRDSTLSLSPLTHHPSQPCPVSSERGALYNHSQPASVAAGPVGQFKPGLGPNIFILGAQHLPRPPSAFTFTNPHRLDTVGHIGLMTTPPALRGALPSLISPMSADMLCRLYSFGCQRVDCAALVFSIKWFVG